MKLIAYRIKPTGEVLRSEGNIKGQTAKQVILDKPLPEADYRRRFQKSEIDHVMGNRIVCSDESAKDKLFEKFEAEIDGKIQELNKIKDTFYHHKNLFR